MYPGDDAEVMHDWNDSGWGWGGWVAMGLMMLAVVAVIVLLVVLVTRTQRESSAPMPPASSASAAERTLDERFARGEIDADEYRTRREVLRSP